MDYFTKKDLRSSNFSSPKNEGYLICVVEDNGVGQENRKNIKKKNLHLHTGFSTEAINDRIRLLNGNIEKEIILRNHRFNRKQSGYELKSF